MIAGAGGNSQYPPDGGGQWWATWSQQVCSTDPGPVRIISVEHEAALAPLGVEDWMRVVEAADTSSLAKVPGRRDRLIGGPGRPENHQLHGVPIIHLADADYAGAVVPLVGEQHPRDCDAELNTDYNINAGFTEIWFLDPLWR